MKKFITLFLLLCFNSVACIATEFDTSIDAEIRKNYNIEQNDLPALPKTVPTATIEAPSVPQYNPTGKTYTIKSGTKVQLISKSQLSGWTPQGSRISFSAKNGLTTKEGQIIPAGTIFKGKVTDSHPPQITGNGGLIELNIDEIYFNGIKSNIESKISSADDKKIFHSNIKGERKYWKNFAKAMTPGRKFFSATQTCASAMAPIPVINVLSIIPLAGGAIFYTANLITAPVISVFQKGENITLPSGTEFEIKITENCQIKG